MRTLHLLSILTLGAALSTPAVADFSVSGGGSAVPASGDGGGNWATGLPTSPGVSSVVVNEDVSHIDAVVINGFQHTWAGDLQATLVDPDGVEHLLFARPGYRNPTGASFGTPGDFVNGTFAILEGSGNSLPTVADGADITPGDYSQSFDTGGETWVSGNLGIFNTPLGDISGPAGTWELRIYDWGFGDNGAFTGWSLNGNSGIGGPNSGSAYCFGDGSGAACPCGGTGATGEGCLNTGGTGAVLTGTGDAVVGADSLVLSVTGGPPDKAGIFFQGTNQIANPVGDGILCSTPSNRYDLNVLDGNGETTQADFGALAGIGETINYQYWFRDPMNPCGGQFNFSSGWTVTWE